MHKLQTLSNSLRLITIPMQGTKTVTVLVMVGTGSKYETKDNNGISHFLEHMFFKGTNKRPTALAISSELDKAGGIYNAFTGKEYTGFWVKVAANQIELALDVVSDMLVNSKFDSAEIEREKGVIIEEINMYQDNPLYYLEDVFEQCLYGDQPAGWDTSGTKQNVNRFKRRDFINYLSSQYGSQHSFVSLAGKINPNVNKLVSKYFSKINTSDFKNKVLVQEKQTKPQIKLHYKKTDQAHLSLGVRTFPLGYKDEFILKMMSILLGGSMSSRLFIQLRERRGLAYYVRSQAEFYTDSGYLAAQAGVPLQKLEQAIKVILTEYKKLTNTLVNNKELDKTKQLLQGRITLQLEASDNVANWYGRSAVLRDKILTPENFFKIINKVTARDIQRVAKNIFKNIGLNLAIIGPFKNKSKFLKILKL